jgi:epoxide hydrolase-like predicted phosphatase
VRGGWPGTAVAACRVVYTWTVARQLRGLLVDYGGVLTNPLPDALGTWMRADGIDPDSFADLMRRWLTDGERNAVHDLETGRISAAEFERTLAAELSQVGEPGGPPPEAAGLLTRMFAGFRREAGMVEAVRAARVAGVRTGLLSNSWGLDYPREDWDALFDVVVISGEVGLRKPDPAIYTLAAQRLGLRPDEVVFVDDLAPNVRAAAAVGMVGVRHGDVDATLDELEVLLGVSLR